MTTTIECQNDQMKLSGMINFDNAEQIYQQGVMLLQQQKTWPLWVDLSALQQGNTLVLAILVQWLRICPNYQSLKLVAVPEKMKGIIQASNLEQLIAD